MYSVYVYIYIFFFFCILVCIHFIDACTNSYVCIYIYIFILIFICNRVEAKLFGKCVVGLRGLGAAADHSVLRK